MIDPELFLNLAYVLMVLGLIVRDILWLRIFLVSSQTCFISYALATDNFSMTAWNSAFIAINAVQVARLAWERRPVPLPADLEDIYKKVFSVMTRREFLYFWETGRIQSATDQLLIREGDAQKELSLIVSGTVCVSKEGLPVVRLFSGQFIAEMSFLTEEPASADVHADGAVSFISWDQQKLANLKQVNPTLLIKLQAILGKDLTHKLKMLSRKLS